MTDYELRKLTAWELLTLRRAAARHVCEDERERALYANAAVLAASLRREGAVIFPDAETVLRAFSAGEVNALTEQYAALDGGSAEFSGGENAAFDPERFRRLKEGGA